MHVRFWSLDLLFLAIGWWARLPEFWLSVADSPLRSGFEKFWWPAAAGQFEGNGDWALILNVLR